MSEVRITTGSRLHFGPLSVAAPAGGRFGGVGVMIESPRVVLTARTAGSDLVQAEESTAKRVMEFIRRIRNCRDAAALPSCEIIVHEMIPGHYGLGSGTQLGLAVSRALSLLSDEAPPSLETLALRVGRGLRSAIGLHGFVHGGFLVDGGRVESDELGTLVCRVDFPADWRFVLARPRETIGLSGEAEQSTFAKQPSMPASLTAELCRIVLMDWLPAVIKADFSGCGNSLYTFGHAVGEFFANAQGAVFAHPRMSQWAALIRRRGIQGVAQSSWGPMLAALCPNNTVATQLQRDLTTDGAWSDCLFDVVSPLNSGASICTH